MARNFDRTGSAPGEPLDLNQVDLVSQLKERGLKPLKLAHETWGEPLNLKPENPTRTDRLSSTRPSDQLPEKPPAGL
jgi:hypothetical protein